jgi:hypothetical protein
MGRVFDMFKPDKEPVPEVETFDFESRMYYVIGFCEALQHAQRINEVKALVQNLTDEVAEWPDG